MLVTPALAAVTLGVGVVAGLMGAMLGIGGGVFLVPFLVWWLVCRSRPRRRSA